MMDSLPLEVKIKCLLSLEYDDIINYIKANDKYSSLLECSYLWSKLAEKNLDVNDEEFFGTKLKFSPRERYVKFSRCFLRSNLTKESLDGDYGYINFYLRKTSSHLSELSIVSICIGYATNNSDLFKKFVDHIVKNKGIYLQSYFYKVFRFLLCGNERISHYDELAKYFVDVHIDNVILPVDVKLTLNSCLLIAGECNNTSLARFLIKKGSDSLQQCLHCSVNSLDIVKMLMQEYGINYMDIYIKEINNAEIFIYLIEIGRPLEDILRMNIYSGKYKIYDSLLKYAYDRKLLTKNILVDQLNFLTSIYDHDLYGNIMNYYSTIKYILNIINTGCDPN